MKISIVGLGVVGGSYAKALKGMDYVEVYGIDIDQDTLNQAKDLGIIKDGHTNGADLLSQSDLVIFALYPRATIKFMETHQDDFKPGSVIMDTSGIKTSIISKIEPLVREDIDFVYTHPMAGRENRGIAYADGEVFKGANFIITPVERNSEDSLQLVEKLAKDLEFGKISRVTPEFHDQMISFTSQLPHVIAVSLMNSDHEKRETGKFTGDSYPELTRIAKINEDLWAELFIDNKEYLLDAIKDFKTQFDYLEEAIKNSDADTLKNIFINSRKRREHLENQLDERKRNQRR